MPKFKILGGQRKQIPSGEEVLPTKQLTAMHSSSVCLMQTENLQPKNIYLYLEKT